MRVVLKNNTKGVIIATSLMSIGFVIFIAINANSSLREMSRSNSSLYDAYEIAQLMKKFRTNLLTQDHKLKRYLFSGDTKFINEYRMEEREIKLTLLELEKRFTNKPQEKQFAELKQLTLLKLLEAEELKPFDEQSTLNERNLFSEDDLNTFEEIHEKINVLNNSLSKSTQVLIQKSEESMQASKNWSIIEVIFAITVALVGLVILLRDINLRNKLELELLKAKKEAENNARAKEQFMANMSHEIRTPMNALLGFTNLLQKTPLSNEQTEYLRAIDTSGSNLLNIINDILDFSKMEAGKLQIEKIPFQTYDVLNSLELLFKQKAEEKSLIFKLHIEPTVPQNVYGDSGRLTQILVNIINNAIKFTDKGSVTLSCELKSVEHNNAQLVFRIKDSGIGIAQDKINDIFERFNQGHKETTRKYGGTGLGLAIVKNLVELQNGNLYVKSKEGYGTEFVITMSYPISYEQPLSAIKATVLYEKLCHQDKIILLAEDNSLNQKLAANYLVNFGFKVDMANNGLEALEKLSQFNYDIVIMDIQMPLLDGYQTALKARKELRITAPIIAMTAHVMPGEKEKCMSFGMDDFISKPFKESELYHLIKRYTFSESAFRAATKIQNVSLQNEVVHNNQPIVNVQDIYDLSRGNDSFLKEMIAIFLAQNPGDIAALKKAVQQINHNEINTLTHKMKTSLGFMGLKNLLPLLDELESLSKKNAPKNSIQEHFNMLESNCSKARKELKNLLRSTPLNTKSTSV